jgi:acetyl-CoA carboxylase biotin carboxyl carrier protein
MAQKPSFDLKYLKELVEFMQSTGLKEMEVKDEGNSVRLTLPVNETVVAQQDITAPQVVTATDSVKLPEEKAEPKVEGSVMQSPIVGTFYGAASPEDEPYVKVGDKVKKGQTVCIIEAMKTMNHIEAEKSGIVTEILVENAQPVEFGEPLFRLSE